MRIYLKMVLPCLMILLCLGCKAFIDERQSVVQDEFAVPADYLFSRAEDELMVPFYSYAALQHVMVEDGLYPVSGETHYAENEGVHYSMQYGESLDGKKYRVYYTVQGKWDDLTYMQSSDDASQEDFGRWLFDQAADMVVLRFEPTDSLQKAIVSEQYIPNSVRFSFTYDDNDYIAQRGERWATNEVKIFYMDLGTETIRSSSHSSSNRWWNN